MATVVEQDIDQEAKRLIDEGLSLCAGHSVVEAAKIMNLLLDLRLTLKHSEN